MDKKELGADNSLEEPGDSFGAVPSGREGDSAQPIEKQRGSDAYADEEAVAKLR